MFYGDHYSGSWQKGAKLKQDTSLSHYAVFSCVSVISQDIAKLPFVYIKLDEKDGVEKVGYHKELESLRRPNNYQNHIQFKELWIQSKLLHGNTYVLVQRHNETISGYFILDPTKVEPMVTPRGDVYYQLQTDNLSGISDEQVIVPAYDIIHDRMNCFFHPLIGLSPIFAASKAIEQGLKIQTNSASFFSNKAIPSGILTAPATISDTTAERMKKDWNQNYTGDGAGKVAVLGDGLKFEAMSMSALDSQLIEQLKMSSDVVCSVFKCPPYIAGVSDKRPQDDVESIFLEYHQKALHYLIESMELSIDYGIGFDGVNESIDLDLKSLMRMDTLNRFKAHSEAIKAGFKTINEVRKEEGLPPVDGGDTPYLQQQNYSLSALKKRDEKEDPFSNKSEKSTVDEEFEKEQFLKSLIEEFVK